MRNLFILLSVGLIFSYSCKDDNTDTCCQLIEPLDTFVLISTDFGEMYLSLHEGTPLHKQNFLKLVNEKFYDSTEFHRIVPNFVIQGGDPNSKDDDRNNDGVGGAGYTIPAEIDSTKYKHVYGAIGAARQGDATNPLKASNGAQFYIVTNVNGTAFLDGNYTVFGIIVKGMDVAKEIEKQPRDFKDLPNKRIKMTTKLMLLSQSEQKELGFL